MLIVRVTDIVWLVALMELIKPLQYGVSEQVGQSLHLIYLYD